MRVIEWEKSDHLKLLIMKQKLNLSRSLITFGIPLFIILSSIFLAKNQTLFEGNSGTMNTAITLDLVLTLPLVYFFLIRKKNISKFTVVPVFVLGIVIASLIIPTSDQQALSLVKSWVLPLVELTVFTIVVTQVVKVRKAYKAHKENLDFLTALKKSTATIFPPRLAYALSTEIGMVYYSFFTWRKPKYAKNEFTYHKDNGALGVLGVLLGVALVELFCVHLLLHNWSPVFTWILTILSAYGVIQIFGLMKSIPRTPIKVEQDTLKIRLGIFLEAEIPLDNIKEIELTTKDYDKQDKTYRRITLFDHNCIIHLKDQGTLKGLFGLEKKYQHLVLSVDDKKRFKTLLENEI